MDGMSHELNTWWLIEVDKFNPCELVQKRHLNGGWGVYPPDLVTRYWLQGGSPDPVSNEGYNFTEAASTPEN